MPDGGEVNSRSNHLSAVLHKVHSQRYLTTEHIDARTPFYFQMARHAMIACYLELYFRRLSFTYQWCLALSQTSTACWL